MAKKRLTLILVYIIMCKVKSLYRCYMEDNFLLYELYSVYGVLLTENQRETIEDHFGLDLSLGEIAEMRGISRQAIKYTLDNAEKALKEYENKLGFLKKLLQVKNLKCEDKSFKERVIKILEDR